MAILQQREFESRLQRTESLIGQLESIPDEESRRSALDAVQALLDLHGDALERILTTIYEDGGAEGQQLLQKLGADLVVGGLLLLHNLHPVSLETRVEQALVKSRPYLGTHGGNVQLVRIEDGVVHLRLEGSCDGCAASSVTLRHNIESEIMSVAPDVLGIVVDEKPGEAKAPAGFVPLATIRTLSTPGV